MIKRLSWFCVLVILVCGSLNLFCPMIPISEASSLPAQHSQHTSSEEGGCFDALVSSLSSWQSDVEQIDPETTTSSIDPFPLKQLSEVYVPPHPPIKNLPQYLFFSILLI